MDPKLLRAVIWLAVAGALLILTALQLMRVISSPLAIGAGALVLVGALLGLRGERR